jgi:large subunit ribosomal protein LX|tara:strand:- start:784 stop:1155 length:372 start_codon:yes stop_codon:yes gene_type:complete
MTSKNFKVSGNYFYRQDTYPFAKTVTAESEDAAREQVYCLMGSNHKLKRGEMEVTGIEIVKAEKAAAPIAKKEAPAPEAVKEAAPEVAPAEEPAPVPEEAVKAEPEAVPEDEILDTPTEPKAE